MSRVILKPKARIDMDGIWAYSEANWGEEQAEKYIRQLWDDLGKLAEGLKPSTDISEIRKGFRKGRSNSHVIFFKRINQGIDVIRVLHRSMDFERHLS